MSNFSLVNNTASAGSQSRLAATSNNLSKTLQRLSSGLRINKSGDDAAGLAIANSFRSDSAVLTQGVRNANDGISTLQIIDGGLNTISGLLDRAASLSSQSASGTFTGDRGTLQAELGKVFSEISRQAQNIGLGGAAGSDEGRFNRAINVFIGGGANANAAGNSVAVDLSNSRVDQTGLNLNNLNIGQGTGNVTGAQDISAGLTGGAETLTFQTVGSSGQLTNFSVSLSNGASSSNVLDTINNDANAQSAGITASLDTTSTPGQSKLVLSSANFFAVSSSTVGTAGHTGIAGATSAIGDVAVTGAANSETQTISAGTAGDTQHLNFQGEKIGLPTNALTINFSTFVAVSAANTDTIVSAVNGSTTLRSGGVFAVRTKADGSEVKFVSLNAFNLNIESTAGSDGTINNIDSVHAQAAATAGTLTGGESGAKAALTAIKAAIATLGSVQGKVGAGQNNLEQAIDLASTQIINFQAAESSIRDADVASEASNLARLSTLQQAGVAALAQANQSSQALLSLLR